MFNFDGRWRPIQWEFRDVLYLSHFKGLFKIFKMRYSTFLYSYWIGLHVHFKKASLHLKKAIGPLLLSFCVTNLQARFKLQSQDAQCLWDLT